MGESDGYRRVTAYLCAGGAADAIAFYSEAFGRWSIMTPNPNFKPEDMEPTS